MRGTGLNIYSSLSRDNFFKKVLSDKREAYQMEASEAEDYEGISRPLREDGKLCRQRGSDEVKAEGRSPQL